MSSAAIVADGGVDIGALGKTSDLDIVTKTAAFNGSPGYAAETSTMTLIRGFLYVITAMILGAFFTVWTIQRRAEIGLQKALGASTRAVLLDALGQVLVVLIGATAIGVAIGLALGALISGEHGAVLAAGWTCHRCVRRAHRVRGGRHCSSGSAASLRSTPSSPSGVHDERPRPR